MRAAPRASLPGSGPARRPAAAGPGWGRPSESLGRSDESGHRGSLGAGDDRGRGLGPGAGPGPAQGGPGGCRPAGRAGGARGRGHDALGSSPAPGLRRLVEAAERGQKLVEARAAGEAGGHPSRRRTCSPAGSRWRFLILHRRRIGSQPGRYGADEASEQPGRAADRASRTPCRSRPGWARSIAGAEAAGGRRQGGERPRGGGGECQGRGGRRRRRGGRGP